MPFFQAYILRRYKKGSTQLSFLQAHAALPQALKMYLKNKTHKKLATAQYIHSRPNIKFNQL